MLTCCRKLHVAWVVRLAVQACCKATLSLRLMCLQLLALADLCGASFRLPYSNQGGGKLCLCMAQAEILCAAEASLDATLLWCCAGCSAYASGSSGGYPTFLVTSATIGNPAGHAAELLGRSLRPFTVRMPM